MSQHLLSFACYAEGPLALDNGCIILTLASRLGANSSHSQALLGEVSSQGSIADLFYVLLDFSLGMLKQVGLALDVRREEEGANQQEGEGRQNSFSQKTERVSEDELLARSQKHVLMV